MSKTNNDQIKLQFYGVRGSFPSGPDNAELEEKIFWLLKDASQYSLKNDDSIRKYIQSLPPLRKNFVGGNTSCIYLNVNNHHIILDAGSGMRHLGQYLMRREFGKGRGKAHIFISHTHWDHIMGFPSFLPAFRSGNEIIIYGVHSGLEQRFGTQQEDEFFPVSLSAMGANIDFVQMRKEETINLGEIKITNTMLNHPGGSFAYRLEYRRKIVVYATDSEYKNLDDEQLQRYIQFFRDADALIFDAQFTIEESLEKENWGHSTAIQGVNMASQAGVKNLYFFHHDPSYSDKKLRGILDNAIIYQKQKNAAGNLNIDLAREGFEIIL
ncbi:MAG: MBL fold metallo-hydrolase [Candidatus Neomarinimicrobiota bacterium]|jgi:phosphoribosyl 1,2-cyclic phosphodiesterase